MTTLFLEACGLLLTILVDADGFTAIPDGYEDELGFHYGSASLTETNLPSS